MKYYWTIERTLLQKGVLAAAALLAFHLAGGLAVAKGGSNVCQETSQVTLKSCTDGAHGDYWLAIGKCDNLPTSQEQNACKRTAREDQKTSLSDCNDQFSARQQVCAELGGGAYHPVINPADFVGTIDNPYLPLPPGTTFIYEGQTASGTEHNEVAVTHETKDILGVPCVVVRDTVTIDGQLVEDTTDWYAQDKYGNVWYFGENAKQYENGEIVGIAGSWTGGVDGALPGILMQASPVVGKFYRQEFALGAAEDMADILSLNESVTVPYHSYDHCLETNEFSPLEPGTNEHKFYAPGVGYVLDIDLQTGEQLALIDIVTE